MGGILELIKLIYGSKALSKVLGTRTNVIRLPDNELKQYTKQELNIEAASNKLAQKVKADMYELLADYPRMNDAEKLIFEGNLRRLGNKLEVVQKKQKPAADVLEFETGEKVSPEGIMSLTEKAGQKNPPTTLMGKLESRIKQLEASGEDLSKMKGQTYDEFMNDITQGQRTMIRLEDEGLVRATAREIIDKDIKSKKIKLPKEVEADFKQGGGEPIDVFRQFYGEDALEQLNSMVPDFRQMYSSKEAAEAAIKKFKFKFKADRPPGSISIEDAKKAEQEFNIVPADSEEGKVITEKLIGKPKAPVTELVTAEKIISDMKNMDPMDAMKEANKVLKREGKYKNLKEEDVERIMEDTNDFIFGRDIPEDPEGFAIGGRVGYSDGTKPSAEENTPSQAIINRMMAQIKQMSKMGADIDTIKTITGASDQMIKDVLGKASGGSMSNGLDYLMGIERRGYAYGSGLKLLNLFKKSKTNLQKEIEKAIDNISLTGDMKLDADRVVDDMLESMNIDRDAVDGYDILDAYDKAYKRIAKLKGFNNLDNKLMDLEKKYIKNIDDKIIEEELFTPAEWAKTPETIKNKVRGQIDPEWKKTTFGEDYDFDVVRGKELEGGIMDISDPETLDDFANFAKQNDPEGYKKIEDMVNEINQKREATKGMSLEDEMNMVLNQYDKSMFVRNKQGMVDVANPENIQKMALLLQKDHPNLYKKLQEQASQVDTLENYEIIGRKPNAKGGPQGLNYLLGM
jgi:uncharacterized protein YfcZ (UPF0381/DUF406 family)